MFTLEELFSKRNLNQAFAHLEEKRDSCGSDGVPLSELKEYWDLNHERIIHEIKEGIFCPGVVKNFEIVNKAGKRRVVSHMCSIDRLICRLLAQKLERYIAPAFLSHSYAYQEGKGVTEAAQQAGYYIEQQDNFVAVLDIKDYFDDISQELLMKLLREKIEDESILNLIKDYLSCKVEFEGQIHIKRKGILQGSPISPVLSNLYLHNLDVYMEETGYHWIRFADNIYIYSSDEDGASQAYNDVYQRIQRDFRLTVNKRKSGVYKSIEQRVLGYDFLKKKGHVEIAKHQYHQACVLRHWQPSAIQRYNQEYHVINDGILNKRDYSLLFESDDGKHYIPVEIVQQINFYSDIIISANVLKTLSAKQIKASFFDKYGDLVGSYVPEMVRGDSGVLLKQCSIYIDTKQRLQIAKNMELASIHNMRANIRYYNKKMSLGEYVTKMNEFMSRMNEGGTIEQLMLIEARARQMYYQVFNEIICNDDFKFERRTKRPPRDPLNALISFGNTVLYNQFLQLIWKTSLDPRIGMVHATNRRLHSLNLDFADIFKPIIVDRVIFKLINCKQLRARDHFQETEEGGIYLNGEGKRIFLTEFQQKLDSTIVMKGQSFTYRKLLEQEVRHFQNFVTTGERYRPYKYY